MLSANINKGTIHVGIIVSLTFHLSKCSHTEREKEKKSEDIEFDSDE